MAPLSEAVSEPLTHKYVKPKAVFQLRSSHSRNDKRTIRARVKQVRQAATNAAI